MIRILQLSYLKLSPKMLDFFFFCKEKKKKKKWIDATLVLTFSIFFLSHVGQL